jgi:branched-chain amino acid transport system substrate-binding protein
MIMKSRFSIVVGMLMVAAMLASCAPAATPTPTAAPVVATPPPATAAPTAAPTATTAYPPAPEFIEIGASIPLTGKFGSLGIQVKEGYDYAIADINAAGGVMVAEYGKKIPLRLTAYDDTSDPTKAVTNLENVFSQQNVVAYLGGAASGMHAATTAIAEKNKVPYLGVSFAWWNIHQRGYKYLFSPFPKSPDQARDVFKALNELIPADQRPKNVAIFQENTDWGNELGGLFKADAGPAGFTVVDYETYAPGAKDFTALVQKAKAAKAEILLGMPSTPDGITIMKSLQDNQWKPKFILLVRGPDAATWGDTFKTSGDGVTFFPGWEYSENFPGVTELNAKSQADLGRPADVLVGPAYSCLQILADAITRAGTLDRDAIRDALATTNMMTVIGNVSFNADGTGNVLNPLVQWQSGKMQLVWPLDMKSASLLFPAP